MLRILIIIGKMNYNTCTNGDRSLFKFSVVVRGTVERNISQSWYTNSKEGAS